MSAHRRALFLMLLSVMAFTANVLLVRALDNLHFANIWLVSCATVTVTGLTTTSTSTCASAAIVT